MEQFAMDSIEDWLGQLKLVQHRYKANEITEQQYDENIALIEERIRDWFVTLSKLLGQTRTSRGGYLSRIPVGSL